MHSSSPSQRHALLHDCDERIRQLCESSASSLKQQESVGTLLGTVKEKMLAKQITLGGLQDENDALRKKLAQDADENDALRKRVSQQEAELQQLRDVNADSLQRHNDDMLRFDGQLSAAQAAKEQLEDKLAQSVPRSELDSRLEHEAGVVANLERELSNALAHEQQLREVLKKTDLKLDSANSHGRSQQAVIGGLEEQLRAAHLETKDALANAQESQNRLSDTQAELSNKATALVAVQHELARSVPAATMDEAVARECTARGIAETEAARLDAARRELVQRSEETERRLDHTTDALRQMEDKWKDEVRCRKKSDAQLVRAEQTIGKLDKRCSELEAGMDELRRQLQVARDSAGLMSTVAKIRSTEIDPKQQAVGFDAVVNRIDRVVNCVDGMTRSKQDSKTMRSLRK